MRKLATFLVFAAFGFFLVAQDVTLGILAVVAAACCEGIAEVFDS